MVAREKNTIHERHIMSCWQTFSMAKKTKKHRRRSTRGESRSDSVTENNTLARWQMGRTSTQDNPREENEDLTGEDKEKNLSLDTRPSLHVTKGETGHYSRPDRRHSNREHRGPGHYQEGRPGRQHYREHRGPGHIQNTVVLDIYYMIQEGIPPKNTTEK